jgi:hypothetical protein
MKRVDKQYLKIIEKDDTVSTVGWVTVIFGHHILCNLVLVCATKQLVF